MVDYNVDTLQYRVTSGKIKGFELIEDNLGLVEERLLVEQPNQHRLMTNAAVQLLEAGGKRIRAAISLLTSGIFGADLDTSISLAAGVEMLHTATLVHDDTLDEASVRRGKPTLNVGKNGKFSILIGDYFFARAANLVAETENLDIIKMFSETLMTILNGEINQQFSLWQVDRQGYYERIYAKTGAMFVLAAKSAAVLGGADESELLALERYGYYTGVAFQIIDDVLDFTSKQIQLGKPVGGDLREGIFTLPVILYADRYPDDPNLNLLQDIRQRDHPAADNLITSIRDSTVIEEAMVEAKELVSHAQDALENVRYTQYTQALLSIANRIVERNV